MTHTTHSCSGSTSTSVHRDLRLSDLVTAAGTFSSSDPGPDPFFDEDPIPEGPAPEPARSR
jgi:hypothetical protein